MLKGSQNLRQRLLLSDLTSTPTLIEDIHADATWPGLLRHEFSLLRLVEMISDDCHVVMSKSMNLSNSKSMKPPCCLQALFGAPEKTHFSIIFRGPNYHKIMESIDDALHLYQKFGLQSSELGLVLVKFIFSVVWQLLDASLDDENLLALVPEKKSMWPIKSHEMEIDDFGEKKSECHQGLYKTNITMATEIVGELFRNKELPEFYTWHARTYAT